MGTPGATPWSNTIGANVANGGMTPLAKDASGNSVALVDAAGNIRLDRARGSASLMLPFGSAGNAVSAGTTVVTQFPADAEFYAVQYLYANKDTASTFTITAAVGAATPTHLDYGDTSTWIPITFNDNGATCPIGTGTGNDIVPGLLASDLMPCVSVARTDDTTKKRLWQARTYCVGAANALKMGGTDFASYNASAASNGYQFAGRIPTGDRTATFTSTYSPVEAGSFVMPSGIKFFYSQRSLLVAGVGDSLLNGFGTTASSLNWMQRACNALSSDSFVVTHANFAWTGQKHAASMATAKKVIATVKPDALVFYAWSPNDTAASQALMDKAWAETLEILDLCRRNSIIPIIATSGPVTGYSAGDSDRIRSQNARVRLLGTSGACYVVDVAAAIANPANLDAVLPAYSSDGAAHYNDAGHAAIAALALPILRSAA